jgi:hypothetical protein
MPGSRPRRTIRRGRQQGGAAGRSVLVRLRRRSRDRRDRWSSVIGGAEAAICWIHSSMAGSVRIRAIGRVPCAWGCPGVFACRHVSLVSVISALAAVGMGSLLIRSSRGCRTSGCGFVLLGGSLRDRPGIWRLASASWRVTFLSDRTPGKDRPRGVSTTLGRRESHGVPVVMAPMRPGSVRVSDRLGHRRNPVVAGHAVPGHSTL